MFDADLTMKLSQHLFDIQFGASHSRLVACKSVKSGIARYIQQSAQRQSSPQPPQPHPVTEMQAAVGNASRTLATTSQRDILELPDVGVSEGREQDLGLMDQPIGPTQTPPPAQEPSDRAPGCPQLSNATKVGDALEETNRLLGEIGEAMKHQNRILISNQHATAWVSIEFIQPTVLHN